jgi:hypothetical protein
MEVQIVVQGQMIDDAQARLGPVGFGDGSNGSIELDDRRAG